ncbi:MAG: hypothetical protein ACLFSQ_10710 [Candidatus Zixiibacteriota bacterium]
MKCKKTKQLLENGQNPAEDPELLTHLETCVKCKREIERYYPEFLHFIDGNNSEFENLLHLRREYDASIEMPDDVSWRKQQNRMFKSIERRRYAILRPAFAGILAAMLILFVIIVNPSQYLIQMPEDNLEIPAELADEYLMSNNGYIDIDVFFETFSLLGGSEIISLIEIDDPAKAAIDLAEELGEETIIATFDDKTQQEFMAYLQSEMNIPGNQL